MRLFKPLTKGSRAKMNRIASSILNHARAITIIFVLVSIASIFGILATQINFNLASYIPDKAASTQALQVMDEQFKAGTPNARLYIPNVTVTEALEKKAQIEAVSDIEEVIWLDDFVDVKLPLNTFEANLVANYYLNNGALYQITVAVDDAAETVNQLNEIGGVNSHLEGQLVDLGNAQNSTHTEIGKIMAYMIPIGILILCLCTSSWLEPLILFAAIGSAVLLNLGTNFIFSEISFITSTVTGILQLAVSMDYGVFLLHAKDSAREKGMNRYEALHYAITKASNAIVASSMTTLLGFLALVFMSFKLGPDLGIVLAKGIVFSLISVLVFMPAMLRLTYRLIEKTTHRPLLPNFKHLGKFVAKAATWLLLILILVPIAFIAQNKSDFVYGSNSYNEGSKAAIDRDFIQNNFGAQLAMVMLVPRNDPGREIELINELEKVPEVNSIISYQTVVGDTIPVQVAPEEQISQLLSTDYSRITIMVDSAKEGEHAFKLVEQMRNIGEKYFPDSYYLTGESVVNYDMRETIQSDNLIVNGLAILSVWLVLLLSFRSLIIPFILVFTIESAIWINLSFPYFSGISLAFIGYLIISSVQLGATVDYAILYTQHYIDNRKHIVNKREAIKRTTMETFGTLLTPALILSVAGFILWIISSMDIISEIGAVLGRGAFISFLMVNFLLPGLLIAFDPIINKTTWKAQFLRRKR